MGFPNPICYEDRIGGGVGGPQWGFAHLIDYEDKIGGGVAGVPQWGSPTPSIMRTELEVGLAGPNSLFFDTLNSKFNVLKKRTPI